VFTPEEILSEWERTKKLSWEAVKQRGSEHYKTGKTEPIDLFKDAGILRHFAIGNIVKYAMRNSDAKKPVNVNDIEKIQHYAEMLMFV